jgi:hypothetical protein
VPNSAPMTSVDAWLRQLKSRELLGFYREPYVGLWHCLTSEFPHIC